MPDGSVREGVGAGSVFEEDGFYFWLVHLGLAGNNLLEAREPLEHEQLLIFRRFECRESLLVQNIRIAHFQREKLSYPECSTCGNETMPLVFVMMTMDSTLVFRMGI